MRRSFFAGSLMLLISVFFVSSDTSAEPKPVSRVRKFSFHYQFHVKGLKPSLKPEDVVRVWVPRPVPSAFQEITHLPATAPASTSEHEERRFGNHILYFQTRVAESGAFTVDVPYEIVRHEVLRGSTQSKVQPVEELDSPQRKLFLAADKLVPTTGKPLKLLDGISLKKDPLDRARQLYDLVNKHVVYKKEGTGWGQGDTNWVCDNGYGDCTDFHSLFMSLARSQGIPARFEIGFSIPVNAKEGKIAGYHCWAWFYVDGRGWIPVDISEASKNPKLKDYYFGNLSADRVAFTTGRDIELVPQSSLPPLNFFIYPHVEFQGETLPAENIELKFTFKEFR